MKKVKISATIANEIYLRELWSRDIEEAEGMGIYRKISEAKSTRKDGAIIIEATEAEIQELYEEADSWSGNFDEYMMGRGEWMAWKSLKKQCRALLS
jgi:hypothetical protein